MEELARAFDTMAEAEQAEDTADHKEPLVCACHGVTSQHITVHHGVFVCDQCEANIVSGVVLALDNPVVEKIWNFASINTNRLLLRTDPRKGK